MTDKVEPTVEEYAEVLRRYNRDGGISNGFEPDHVAHIDGAETVDDLELTDELLAEAWRRRGNDEYATRLLGGRPPDEDGEDDGDLSDLFGGGTATGDGAGGESPWAGKSGPTAGLLSVVWPGLGHVYLGGDATGRGLGLLVYSVLSVVLISVAIGVPMYIMGAAFAYFDTQSLIDTGSGISSEAEP